MSGSFARSIALMRAPARSLHARPENHIFIVNTVNGVEGGERELAAVGRAPAVVADAAIGAGLAFSSLVLAHDRNVKKPQVISRTIRRGSVLFFSPKKLHTAKNKENRRSLPAHQLQLTSKTSPNMSAALEQENRILVFILGAGGVGKSTLAHRFVSVCSSGYLGGAVGDRSGC